jgi:Mg2+/Co2+ transporter CorB
MAALLSVIDMGVVGFLALILLLLLFSAFFSASETAVTAASRARMHTLEEQGDTRAGLVNRLRAQKERLLGAILLGNNLANILASSLATSILIAWFGSAGVAYATIVMTVLVLLFAEVLPKSFAIHHADRAALALAPALNAAVWIFAPVTLALTGIVRVLFRLFGVEVATGIAGDEHEEELRGVIELHRGPAPETLHERRMLRSVLDLADVEVGQIMVHRKNVLAIEADVGPAAIIDQVIDSQHSRIPLWRGNPDNIVGVLHAKDLLRAVRREKGEIDRLDILALAAKPWFIPETTRLLDQLQAFRRRREHIALVVDEYGSFLGLVALEDILEEIVGDIADEHDVPATGVRAEPGGSYLVEGSVAIRDLNREFDWRLPEEDASTVAGLVLREARMIPEAGQVFTFHGFRFEVLRRHRNQITLLRVTPLPSATEAA